MYVIIFQKQSIPDNGADYFATNSEMLIFGNVGKYI